MKKIKILKKDGKIEEKTMYSLKETADFFGVTPATIFKWIEKGVFKFIKFGRQTFIADDEIIRFQKENTNIQAKDKE